MIIGVKRKTTAIESTQRFFQTINLILSHFKRDADKKKIFELTNEDSTLNDLLIATAAVHIYHNIGIRVEDSFELRHISVESTAKLELMEKQIFFDEVKTILKDSFKLECDMLYRTIDLENEIISYLTEIRTSDLKELQKNEDLEEIENHIEKNLMDIILNYPPFYFYDLIGDFIGLTNEIKMEILEESSAFKELSVEIERKLEMEEKEDKFIELATLNRLINKIQAEFEFKSYKELQMQQMSVRMIKRRILDYNIERFPISIPGLNAFKNANDLKKDIIKKIENTINLKINYEQFEQEISSFLKDKIIEQLKTNPNDFIYYLQCLNENSFTEIIYMLHNFGLQNILHLINMDDKLPEKVKENMIRYNIKKFDLMNLSDLSKNIICNVEKAICELKFPYLQKIINYCEGVSDFNLSIVLIQDKPEFLEFWKILEEKTGYTIHEIRECIRKKDAINKIFFQNLGLKSYSQIITVLNFDEIIDKIVKDTYFNLFSKILRQLSRIIELYSKVINDKALILLALKKIYGTTDSEKWIRIKLEELIIERIIKRQKEMVVVFNAMNQPFLVNGFIYARFIDSSLKEGNAELKDVPSPIFKDIMPLTLNSDLISSISYCLAFDLIKRFEEFEQKRKLKVEKIIESKEKAKEEKKKVLREKQEESTLNWIERRITSSLMRINSPGINPNQLYWQEKDTRITTDNIKLHSELKGDADILLTQFFYFAIEKIKSLAEDVKIPPHEKIKDIVNNNIEKLLNKRLGHSPSQDEINNMIEGERLEIAKQIATRIGKILDKALYLKFKSKRKLND